MPEPLAPEGAGLRTHLRKLFSHSAVYGAADVFTNVVNFLLVPLYTAYLTPRDYGNLALLILFGTMAKIVFRLGLDAGFFRVHYEMEDEPARRRLAGSVAAFAALSGGALFGLTLLLLRPISGWLFSHDASASETWLVLVALDVFLGTFAFIPLNLLRIADRPQLFSAFSTGRHTVNIVLKVVFVMRGLGVAGILWSDLVATGLFSLALLPILWRGSALSFSWPLLRSVLGFGLPKVPHGVMVQALNLLDRKILDLYVTRSDVGLYQMAYTFGTAIKFALSAFEPAWGPFVYSQMKRADAPVTLGRVVTYVAAVFVGTGLTFAVLGRELLILMTPRNPAFWAAAPVIPVVTLAYVLHGVFLLTSIGIGIQKRAGYYPLITAAAAATNIGANFLLIPCFGMLGAAWATVFAYFVMAALGFHFSQRLFQIRFEHPRLLRVALVAALCFAASLAAPDPLLPAITFKLACLAAFPGLLFASGFLGERERVWVSDQLRSIARKRSR